MSTLKLRLKKIEEKLIKPVMPLIVFLHDGVITPQQQQQIDEAEKAGREIKRINIVVVPGAD